MVNDGAPVTAPGAPMLSMAVGGVLGETLRDMREVGLAHAEPPFLMMAASPTLLRMPRVA